MSSSNVIVLSESEEQDDKGDDSLSLFGSDDENNQQEVNLFAVNEINIYLLFHFFSIACFCSVSFFLSNFNLFFDYHFRHCFV